MRTSSQAPLTAFLGRYPGVVLYTLYFLMCAYILWQGRQAGLFPAPLPGTDQHTMLHAALDLAQKRALPPAGYMYSPAYTALLTVFAWLGGGNLIAMRLFQVALCALIPVFTRQLAREIGCDRNYAFLAGALMLFYGPLPLHTLDFLRAAPLALVLTATALLLLRALRTNRAIFYWSAGLLAGVCVLGRETLLGAALAPAAVFLVARFRQKLCWRRMWGYPAGLLLVVGSVVLCNGLRFGRWNIVPGHYANVMECYYIENAQSPWKGIFESLPARLFEMFGSPEIPNSLSLYAHREIIPFLNVLLVPATFFWGAAILGFLFGIRRRSIWILAFMAAGFAAALPWFPVYSRFRLPVMPLLAALAAGGIGGAVAAIRRRAYSVGVPALIALTLILLCFYRDAKMYRTESERVAVVRILLMTSRFAEAERRIDELEADGFRTDYMRRELDRRSRNVYTNENK